MKYHIREKGGGGELTVPDGSYLVMLVRQKFLSPEDEVRRDGSQHWRRIRDVPEYAQMLRHEKNDSARFARVFVSTTLMAIALVVLFTLF